MIGFVDFTIVNLTLFILVLVFDLGLSANKQFKLNRVVLLVIPLISLITLLEFSITQIATNSALYSVTLPLIEVSEGVGQGTSFSLWWAYFTVGTIYFVWRIFGSFRLYFRGRLSETQPSKYACYTVKEFGNYSFFNRIFLLEEDLQNELIVKHEEVHIKQKHTWDVLFSELVIALLWINPMVWRLKILIRQNHEYLADQELVLNSKQNTSEYIHLLLDRALSTDHFSLGNYFSLNSLISKRIIMLNKTKTQKTWKTLTITSVMVG